MKKKFNAAVIGLGVGEKHLEGYVRNPHVNIIYAVDKNYLQIKKIKKKFKKIEFLKNPNKVFKDSKIDILSIATYDDSHYQLIMKALDHNMHVFVEKPMCQYSWQLKKIEKKIKEKKLVLYSNLILKKSKLFIDLKKKISQNFFGKIFHIEADYNYGRVHKIKSNAWRSKIPFYSVTQGGGIHLVDLILWLTGKKVKSIFSYANKIVTKKFAFRYPDNVLSILKLEDDTTVKLSTKFGSVNRHHHNLSIYGSKKTFENLITGPILHDNSKYLPKKISANYKTYKKSDLIDTFIELIQNKKKYSFEEFKNSLNICFAIDKSHKKKKEIYLK
jgi:predicted dehydrogenase